MVEFFERLLEYCVGSVSRAGDPEPLRLRKKIFLVGVTASFSVSLVAGFFFQWLGIPAGAWIAYGICALDLALFLVFFRVHRAFPLLLHAHIFLSLLFPFVTQCLLGGFGRTGGLGLWAVVAPVSAIVQEMPLAWLWLGAFIALEGATLATEPFWVAHGFPIPAAYSQPLLMADLAGLVSILFFSIGFVLSKKRRLMEELEEEHRRFTREHERTERLLRNILPDSIADQLKAKPASISQFFPDASVLFADIAGFTRLSSELSATQVVDMLNHIFSLFDLLVEEFSLEKIKTIGDAYMAVGNLPEPSSGHLESMADLALAMRQVFQQRVAGGSHGLELRIGIHCGPVVAGVIGRRKFSYDLWGDTVNVAHRMESNSLPGRIQISERVFERLKGRYALAERGLIEVKGKGELKAYWLEGKRVGELRLPDLDRAQAGTGYHL